MALHPDETVKFHDGTRVVFQAVVQRHVEELVEALAGAYYMSDDSWDYTSAAFDLYNQLIQASCIELTGQATVQDIQDLHPARSAWEGSPDTQAAAIATIKRLGRITEEDWVEAERLIEADDPGYWAELKEEGRV